MLGSTVSAFAAFEGDVVSDRDMMGLLYLPNCYDGS